MRSFDYFLFVRALALYRRYHRRGKNLLKNLMKENPLSENLF
jgi:hypothetical protein